MLCIDVLMYIRNSVVFLRVSSLQIQTITHVGLA